MIACYVDLSGFRGTIIEAELNFVAFVALDDFVLEVIRLVIVSRGNTITIALKNLCVVGAVLHILEFQLELVFIILNGRCSAGGRGAVGGDVFIESDGGFSAHAVTQSDATAAANNCFFMTNSVGKFGLATCNLASTNRIYLPFDIYRTGAFDAVGATPLDGVPLSYVVRR